MRTKLRSKVTLLFLTFAVAMFAFPVIAFGQTAAPTIQSDQEVYSPGQSVTLTGANWAPGDTIHIVVDDTTDHTWQHTANVIADSNGGIKDVFSLPSSFVSQYSVTATDQATGDQATTTFFDDNTVISGPTTANVGDTKQFTSTKNGNGCDTTSGTWTIQSGSASATINSQNQTSASVTFNAAGTVTLVSTWNGRTNGGAACTATGTYTVTVSNPTPADTTPPNISYVLNPPNPDGDNDWYKSNVSLTWTVTDPQSAFTKTGCNNQNITTDQAATTYSCSASSAGGSAGPVSVTIKRDASAPTGIAFDPAGPANGGSYAFGNVPAAPTSCTANYALSGPGSCVVSGYGTSVGTHTVKATATDDAGNVGTLEHTYTVTKANQTITGFDPIADKIYGAPNFNVSASASSGLPVSFAASGDCTVTGTTVHITGAGSCTITASQNGDGNYNAAPDVSQSFDIAKANATIDVDGYSDTYDGDPHGATGTATGVNNEDLSSLLHLGDSFTNVPGGTAHWTFDGDDNYNAASGSVPIVISKADATINVDDFTGTYDGNPHHATGTATGVKDEDLSSLLDLGDSFTDVPGGTAHWTFAGNNNYNADSGTANIAISKAPSITEVTCTSGPFVYKGTAFEPCSAKATGAGGLNVAVTPVIYTNNVNAGTATATATYNGDGNHDGSSGQAHFTIDPRPITVTADPKSKLFNDPDPPLTYVVSGGPLVAGHSFTGSLIRESGEAVGQYNILQGTVKVSDGNNGDNYKITYNGAKLTIGAWTLKGFYQPVDMGIINNAKAGSTVPLKFEIFKGDPSVAGSTELTNVSDIKQSFTQAINCASGTGDDIESYSSGSTSLRYDTTGGQFIFNWQTPKKAGACYRVTLTTLDGSQISADFRLK